MNWVVEEQFLPEDMGVSNGVWIIDTQHGTLICEISPAVANPIATGKMIIRAVSCFNPLLAALENLRDAFHNAGYATTHADEAIKLAREVVK
jgi:hypothetical protein